MRHNFFILSLAEGCQCPRGTVELGDRCVQPEECPDFSQCLQPIETGTCRAFIPSWGYNSTSGQCERFIYGGCMGNDNLFCSREECNNVCGELCIGPVYTFAFLVYMY